MKIRPVVLGCTLLALALPAAAQADGQVKAGAAVVDGTYHVGNSAGQYASTRDGGYGDVDPHAQSVKNQASYGVQSRESVRAIVVQDAAGKLLAIVSDDHYIPQDALWRRTAQLLDADTGGKIGESNLTMSVTHNHSSPSYSSFDWGVWSFQDVFDYRFFDYYAHQNAKAVEQALANLHAARVSGTVSYFDKFQRNPMGPGQADDGSPDGFPKPFTDHDLSVVRFENVDDPHHPQPLATLINIGQHPEMLEGYDLISGEWPATTERFVDRTVGGVTMITQNATGTSEVERDSYHSIHERELFDHAQYQQMEWGARQLANSVIGDVRDIDRQRPNPDRTSHYGMTSYHDRFVPWMTSFPVAMDDKWFPGPVSHPYPGVSSCRTDPAFQGDPRLPLVGLPDCEDMPWGDSLQPVTTLGGATPGFSTDTLEALGVPVPENYSAPSQFSLEDTDGVHMQAFRLGDILFTVCSCEQWVDQAYNIKTRTDTTPGNEWLGYDPTAPDTGNDPYSALEKASEECHKNGDGTYADDGSGTGTWTCSTSGANKLSDHLIEHMRAQILNDASGWDDPTCTELGCGAQAESEPTALNKVRGNYTHDDTTVRGGKDQTADFASKYGYKMTVTIAMANDYNGYIATYREFMDHDHYRKALTGWGPHSSDYFATRLSELGHALKGDAAAQKQVTDETDPSAGSAWAPMATKEIADQAHEEAKVKAVGEGASAGVQAYDATLPDDGGTDAEMTQPKDIQRFDAATFTWDGGNNYTDNPEVTVERKAGDSWVPFANQSGEIPVTLQYPASANCTKAGDVYGGNPTNGDLPNPDPSKVDPACAAADAQGLATGTAAYRAGGQVWKWTATFEAFVSMFDLVDPSGHTYQATPPGTYRFVVHGQWRKGNADADYTRISNPFEVQPWNGITVEDAKRTDSGTVSFAAGPSHTIAEPQVRRTETHNFGTLSVPVGPVDFPDTAADQKATGARFLNHVRGYAANSPTDLENYCLDCRFRPWMDATGDLTATVTFHTGGKAVVERVRSTDGHFATKHTLGAGETASVVIADAWGDSSGQPTSVTG
jgi:hypothetical protein